jgi:hypothetical protein
VSYTDDSSDDFEEEIEESEDAYLNDDESTSGEDKDLEDYDCEYVDLCG